MSFAVSWPARSHPPALKFLIGRSFASTAPAFCKTFVKPCPHSAINKPCYVKILLTVSQIAALCYQGHEEGNKPRNETRPAAALQQKMGWSADCPCPCPAWPALALQPWTPPSQAMWQFPRSQSTVAAFSEPQPCYKAGPGAFTLVPLQAGRRELLQQPSCQQGQETRSVPTLPGMDELFFCARRECSNLLPSKAVWEAKVCSSFTLSFHQMATGQICFPDQ